MNNAQKLGSLLLIGIVTVAACSDDEDTTTTTNGTTTTTTASVGGSGGDGTGAAGGTGGTGVGGDGGAPSCYAGHPCDPLEPGSCAGADAACDLGGSGLECYSDGNTALLGEDCGDPVFCVHGLTCPGSVGTCVEICCDDDDCTSGTCQPHPDLNPDLYEVFVCLP